MFEWHSALAGSAKSGRDGASGGRRLRLSEVRGWHLAQLAEFEDHHGEFAAHVDACSGAALPVELYRGAGSDASRLVRITAHQYWWISTRREAMVRLARELPASAGTITLLSASRVRLRISGSAAREVLAKGISLDLHPAVFQVGQSAQTGLHHSGVFLERVGEDSYEIYVPRTYAESIWEWLIDAALQFGYDVGEEEAP